MPGQRIVDVEIDSLQFGLSPRKEDCDPQHVAALAEVLNEVPPILVHEPTMRVIDGAHRVLAARSTGQTAIRAEMFDGDETAAHIEAVHRNVTHGKPLSLGEREDAAVRFLQLVPEWSDRRIATVSGLSPKTVGRLRGRATGDSPHLRVRVGKDGRSRPVDPSELRRLVVEAVRADPVASNRAIARRTGASQGTVRDVRERLARGESGLGPTAERRAKRTGPAASAVPGRPGAAGPVAADAPGGSGGAHAPGPASGPPAPSGPPDAGDFAAWFAARAIDEADWRPLVDAIPLSRVYEVADDCRRRGESWRAFASALEDRARSYRRPVDPRPSRGVEANGTSS